MWQAAADVESPSAVGMLIWPLCNLCPQVDSILDSIYVYRVHDYIEQIAVVTSLEKFLDEHPRVKLVGFPSPFCRPRWS